jgi:hypothetical protein
MRSRNVRRTRETLTLEFHESLTANLLALEVIVGRKVGGDRLGSLLRFHFRIYLLVGESAGGARIRARRIPATTTNHSWDREASWSHRLARPWFPETERVGVCWLHVRMDFRDGRTLRGS